MRFLKKVRNLLIIIMLFGTITAIIDYYRMINGKVPVFCMESFDQKDKIETFRGLFYKASRKIKRSTHEDLDLSNNVEYSFLIITKNISLEHPKEKQEYVLYVKEKETCSQSEYYYELDDKKIYLDCIDEIKLKEGNSKISKELKTILISNPTIIEDIKTKLSFVGTVSDNKIEKYRAVDDSFVNKKIILYQCNTEEVKDIYITTKDTIGEDYCTKKRDSMKKE